MNGSVHNLSFIILLFSGFSLIAQVDRVELIGEITYSTSSNYYVRFNNTSAINVGDTLFYQSGGMVKPCLIVSAKSSTTCVSTIVNGAKISKGQRVYHFSEKKKENKKVPVAIGAEKNPSAIAKTDTVPEIKKKATSISGRVNLANYSNFGLDSQTANHRQFVALQMKAKNLVTPGLSADVYANYSRIVPSLPSTELANRNLFRLFRASINYDFKDGSYISLGRKYNSKLASIGSIDGVQFEKSYKNIYAGGIAGFRPNLFDFSFNSSLFLYGLYAGVQFKNSPYRSTSTLGFISQYNSGRLDRSFATLQHSGYLKKFSFFLSSELELYNPLFNTLRLSSLFLSSRYRINKKASVFLSYDTRRAVIFYTSNFQNMMSLEDDMSREGLRLRFNYRFSKKVSAGVSANYRFQRNGGNKATNYYANVRFNEVPLLGGNVNLATSINASNSLKSFIPSVRYSRDFMDNDLNVYLFYRYQDYTYVRIETVSIYNNFFGAGAAYRITNLLRVNIFGEYSGTSTGEYLRFNFSISKQF